MGLTYGPWWISRHKPFLSHPTLQTQHNRFRWRQEESQLKLKWVPKRNVANPRRRNPSLREPVMAAKPDGACNDILFLLRLWRPVTWWPSSFLLRNSSSFQGIHFLLLSLCFVYDSFILLQLCLLRESLSIPLFVVSIWNQFQLATPRLSLSLSDVIHKQHVALWS